MGDRERPIKPTFDFLRAAIAVSALDDDTAESLIRQIDGAERAAECSNLEHVSFALNAVARNVVERLPSGLACGHIPNSAARSLIDVLSAVELTCSDFSIESTYVGPPLLDRKCNLETRRCDLPAPRHVCRRVVGQELGSGGCISIPPHDQPVSPAPPVPSPPGPVVPPPTKPVPPPTPDSPTPTEPPPVLCPCPVGIRAEITIKKLGFTLVDKTEVVAGNITNNSDELPEQSLEISYDFKNSNMGMLSDGSVTVKYKLTLYYAQPKPKRCCAAGKLHFLGSVVFDGKYKKVFGDDIIVNNARAPVDKTDDFGDCPANSTPECSKHFAGNYNRTFYFSIPTWAPLPSWDGSITIKGTFDVDVTTKKQP